MNLASKWFSAAICVAISLSSPAIGWAQATALPHQDVSAIYQRLLPQIEKIPIVDMHAHPGYWDDSDVDAMAVTVTDLDPFRTRDTNPEWAVAAKALFGYPYSDFSPEHKVWLDKKDDELRKEWGKDYWNRILDKVGIEVGVANRVAMDYLAGNPRFRWVVFVDPFMFPFNNHDLAINPDRAVYFPIQEKVLHRYIAQAGASQLPADLAGYEALINKVIAQDKHQGAVAIKFEAPYFRSLVNISDPPREKAEAIYRKYSSGGTPSAEDYLVFQDYIFRYLIVQAGLQHVEVHITVQLVPATTTTLGKAMRWTSKTFFEIRVTRTPSSCLFTEATPMTGSPSGWPPCRTCIWIRRSSSCSSIPRNTATF